MCRILSIFILLQFLIIPASYAQQEPNLLFQFSRYWQQEPINETSMSLNFEPGPFVDENDLLRIIQRLTGPEREEVVIDIPGIPRDATPLVMVPIPAGSFLMGSYPGEENARANEEPQHFVFISQDFYMSKYEITKAQWESIMGTTPWVDKMYVQDASDSPAVYISWEDVAGSGGFIEKLNELDQGEFRLPTEAEWEYACRAGTTTRYYWGDDPGDNLYVSYAWFVINNSNPDEKYTHVVGQLLPNAWGLYDMNGNVYEYCQDWYGLYSSDAITDPTGPVTGPSKVSRGGYFGTDPFLSRSASRNRSVYGSMPYGSGFRVVMSR